MPTELYSRVFVEANLIVAVGALALVRLLRLRGLLTNVIGFFVCFVSQITLSLLITGLALARLGVGPVLLVNLVISAVLVGTSHLFGGPIPSVEWGRPRAFLLGLARELVGAPLASILILVGLVALGAEVVFALLLPPYGYDAYTYHLPMVAVWMQTGNISTRIPYNGYSNVYPADTELMYTWLALFVHNYSLQSLCQVVYSLAGWLAVAGIGRVVGLRRSLALAAGALYFLTPIVLANSLSSYVDMALAAMCLILTFFTLRHIYQPRTAHLALAGLAGGLCIGMKSTGVVYVAIAVALLAGSYAWRWWRPGIKLPSKTRSQVLSDLATATALFAIPTLAFGIYWYARDWVNFGNPVYPYTITLFGHVLPGQGTVEEVLVNQQTPPQWANLPGWRQAVASWQTDLPGQVTTYGYDQRLGGFGVQWPLLELPAFVLFALYALWKRLDLCFTLVLPTVTIFLLQPASWWSRYIVFIVGPAAVALFFLLQQLPGRFSHQSLVFWKVPSWVIHALLMLCVLDAALFSASRTLPKFSYFSTQQKVTLALSLPSSKRTVGAIWLPQYQWVDRIPAGSKIGYTAPENYDFSLAYPLFGYDLQNQVILMRDLDETHFLNEIFSEHIQYVTAAKDYPYLGWLIKRPKQFQVIATSPDGSKVFRVISGPAHRR
jgi:hypothetical protein